MDHHKSFRLILIIVINLIIIERTNANWSSWAPWGNCSKPCNTGQQMRNRTCHIYQPSPTLGGSNCTGNDTQIRKCNIHFCEGLFFSLFRDYRCDRTFCCSIKSLDRAIFIYIFIDIFIRKTQFNGVSASTLTVYIRIFSGRLDNVVQFRFFFGMAKTVN